MTADVTLLKESRTYRLIQLVMIQLVKLINNNAEDFDTHGYKTTASEALS